MNFTYSRIKSKSTPDVRIDNDLRQNGSWKVDNKDLSANRGIRDTTSGRARESPPPRLSITNRRAELHDTSQSIDYQNVRANIEPETAVVIDTTHVIYEEASPQGNTCLDQSR